MKRMDLNRAPLSNKNSELRKHEELKLEKYSEKKHFLIQNQANYYQEFAEFFEIKIVYT